MTKKKEKPEIVMHPEISKWRKTEREDKALRQDIKDRGLLHNIIFRRLPDGKLQLIAGHRRYRELRALGVPFEKIDKKILENISEKEALLIAVSENRFRKDMSAVEEGRAFQSLRKVGRMSIEEIALRYKCSEAYVKDRLALLELPEKIQELIERGEIEMSYAKPINRLKKYGLSAQMALVKKILEGKQHYYGGVRTVEEADKFVEEIIQEIEHTKKLVAKYGPCPKCGSKQISEATWERDRLKCDKCGFEWHAKTKEPWEVFELKQKAEEMGFKVEIKQGKAEMTPEDITTVISKVKEKMKEEMGPLPKTLRTTHTVREILEPFIRPDNINLVRVDGEKIEIRLIEDSDLHFTARRHNYKTGEKTRVKPLSVWDKDKAEVLRKVKKFIESLDLE